jgi:hypothetical protein
MGDIVRQTFPGSVLDGRQIAHSVVFNVPTVVFNPFKVERARQGKSGWKDVKIAHVSGEGC